MTSRLEAPLLDESVRREGFLSDRLGTVVEHHRKENGAWFELGNGLNRLSMQLLWSLKPSRRNEQEIIVGILFGRCMSAYQGALLLAERGMILEARYVLRALLESTFALVANVRHKEFHKQYIKDGDHRLLAMIKACVRLPAEMKTFHKLNDKELDIRKRAIEEQIKTDNSKPLGVKDIAVLAGMESHYDTTYRILSNTAHASVRDLDYHIIPTADAEIDRLGWGPRIDGIPDVMLQACDYLFIGAKAVLDIFERPEFVNQYDALFRRFETLLEQ